tara:strand:+ start:1007 stop:1225 length:219 start_codon:yes stop_codon:yes gene_type:complete
MEQENKITIDGKDYDIESLSQQQKYYVTQIKLVQNKVNELNLQVAQFNAAKSTFIDELIKSTREDSNESETK